MTTGQIYAVVNAAVIVGIVWVCATLLMRSNRHHAEQIAKADAERLAANTAAPQPLDRRDVIAGRDHLLAK